MFGAGTRHEIMATHHQKCGRRYFDQTLQSVPARRWRPPEFSRCIQNQIENDKRKISVAQKQVRRFHRLPGVFASNPEQMSEGIELSSFDIERIAPINKRKKEPVAL